MFSDSAGVWIAVAGLGVVCAGTALILLFLLIRMTGSNLFSFFGVLIRGVVTQEREDKKPTQLPQRRIDLRATAQQVDFETAVMAQQVEAGQQPNVVVPDADSGLPPSVFDSPGSIDAQDVNPVNPRTSRLPRYSGDEVFGGMLDNDGDGRVDY
jgi:hypothetical protein